MVKILALNNFAPQKTCELNFKVVASVIDIYNIIYRNIYLLYLNEL